MFAFISICPPLKWYRQLTHWGRVTHICVSKLTIIGSDNGLPPDRRQAIIWTNAGISLIGPLATNFSEILIEILTFSFKKMRLKVSSAKWRPFCLSLNELKSFLREDRHLAILHTWCQGCWWPGQGHRQPLYWPSWSRILLTHWGRDKMDAIFQTTFSKGFSWMKMNEFCLRFHWKLFLRFELTIFQHWFR